MLYRRWSDEHVADTVSGTSSSTVCALRLMCRADVRCMSMCPLLAAAPAAALTDIILLHQTAALHV
jgi:hypothetical protein